LSGAGNGKGFGAGLSGSSCRNASASVDTQAPSQRAAYTWDRAAATLFVRLAIDRIGTARITFRAAYRYNRDALE